MTNTRRLRLSTMTGRQALQGELGHFRTENRLLRRRVTDLVRKLAEAEQTIHDERNRYTVQLLSAGCTEAV